MIDHPVYLGAYVAALRLGYPEAMAFAYAKARRWGFGPRLALRAARCSRG